MPLRSDPPDVDELEELPPLDELDRDESEGPAEDDVLPLLEPIEEDVDLDEDEAPLDIGLGVEVEEAESDADEPGDVVLDMTELLSEVDEDAHPEEGDVAGPSELDLSADIDTEGEEMLGSNEEGTDEPYEDLVSDELPELDADEPGGFENETAWLEIDSLRDEALPPHADPWVTEDVATDDADLAALAVTSSGMVVGGVQITFTSIGRSVSLGRTRAVGLAALAGGGVVAQTAGGELLRVQPDGEPEPVGPAFETTPRRLDVALCEDAPDGDIVVIGDGSSLARSRDGGAHFTVEQLPGAIVALSGDAALLRGPDGWTLAERRDGTWSVAPLSDEGRDIAEGESVLFAACGPRRALAAAERGVAVATEGASFVRVPGCLHASALTVGRRGGADKAWVALFLESDERAVVVEVDLATKSANVIVEIDAQGEDDTDHDARILALAWDAEAEVLWAAGAGLLVRSTPPRPE
jgi:hypothetical protein